VLALGSFLMGIIVTGVTSNKRDKNNMEGKQEGGDGGGGGCRDEARVEVRNAGEGRERKRNETK
jgi:hypothetical protein